MTSGSRGAGFTDAVLMDSEAAGGERLWACGVQDGGGQEKSSSGKSTGSSVATLLHLTAEGTQCPPSSLPQFP